MAITLRNFFICFLFIVFFSHTIYAQPKKGQFITVSAGLGLSALDYEDESELSGRGFYVHGEYVYGITKWFGLRPYAAIIITSPDKNGNQPGQPIYQISSKALMIGGKVRLCAPIPWIAPFFEVGLGASVGKFETITPTSNIEKSGILPHVPVSLGLALGPKHNVELAFSYYYHSSVDQMCGAVEVGFTFPLD